jgi:hypothetical protein
MSDLLGLRPAQDMARTVPGNPARRSERQRAGLEMVACCRLRCRRTRGRGSGCTRTRQAAIGSRGSDRIRSKVVDSQGCCAYDVGAFGSRGRTEEPER